jgi:hypothetical protein
MLRLDWSRPVGEMVKVAWALFNLGGFDERGEDGEPEIRPPHFDDIATSLDLGNLSAVLEAMQLRKGLYGAPFPPPPRTEARREAYRRQGFTDSMIDQVVELADQQIAHDQFVGRVHQTLIDRLEAFALELESQAAAGAAGPEE